MAQQKAVEVPVDDTEDLVDELQPGTKLLKGQYTITRYLNSGGFGITYLAKDSLDRNVVIKECFPGSFCRRSKALVAARSRAHTAELRSVVQLFVREARSLAKIVHPNIVAVHQVFEDNGTAYMAIDFIDGLDLQQVIDGQGKTMSPPEIVRVTEKLLEAVGFIHANDMLHRDISPDNILIDKSGEPVLIDFGAAREQASQKSRAMSALRVVKDGYSPQEFYIAGSEQGPWSDLYALGATLYHLISGEAPTNGQARLAALAEDRTDPYVPLAGRFAGYPVGFLEAIDVALATLPKQRLQSAAAWLARFRRDMPQPSDGTAAAVHRMVTDFTLEAETPAVALAQPVAPPPAPAVAVAPSTYGMPPKLSRQPSVQQAAVAPAAPAAGGRSPVQVVAGVAVALTVVVAGLLLMRGGDEAVVEPEVATAAEVPAAEPAPADVATADVSTAPPAADKAPAPAVVETAVVETQPAPPVEAEPAAVEVAAAPEAEPAAVEPDPAPVDAGPDVTLDAADVALIQDASRLSSAEAAIMEAVLNTQSIRLPFASPIGTLRDSQTTLTVWDVEMPFTSDKRTIGGEEVGVVVRLDRNVDLEVAGDWLQPGLILYAVNGVPIRNSGNVTTAVLNAMQVDPDGKSRVVVDYTDSTLQRKTGLLTVKAVRLVNLANGVGLAVSNIDGEWRSVVTRIDNPSETNLQLGDVLFREKQTQILFDKPDSIETIMAALVQQGTTVTNFSVLRDNKVAAAAMRLSVDATR